MPSQCVCFGWIMQNTRYLLTVCGLLWLVTPEALATVYKYRDPNGRIYFTDRPVSDSGYKLEWRYTAPPAPVMAHTPDASPSRKTPFNLSSLLQTARVKGTSAAYRKYKAIYGSLVDNTAQRTGLSPALLHAVVKAESGYNPNALSPKGASGIMQLMPDTARRYGVVNIWDPQQNLDGGARYLKDLLALFNNDLRLAIAGYNAGENAVIRAGNRIPPYAETQTYVGRVVQSYLAEAPASGTFGR